MEKQDIINEFLEGLAPSETEVLMTLPSNGALYGKKKAITIRPMYFGDEKVTALGKEEGADIINLILDRTVKGINIEELTEFDKLFLMIQLRILSYGSDFKAEIICPTCREENKLQANLRDLQINYLKEDFVDPFWIKFPQSKIEALVKFTRVSDEEYLGSTPKIRENVWRFVKSLKKGKTESSDPEIISKVLNGLIVSDIRYLMKEISGEDYGIKLDYPFTCKYCSSKHKIILPLATNFFQIA